MAYGTPVGGEEEGSPEPEQGSYVAIFMVSFILLIITMVAFPLW